MNDFTKEELEKINLFIKLAEEFKSEKQGILFAISFGRIGNCIHEYKKYSVNIYRHNYEDTFFNADNMDDLIKSFYEFKEKYE